MKKYEAPTFEAVKYSTEESILSYGQCSDTIWGTDFAMLYQCTGTAPDQQNGGNSVCYSGSTV